MKKLTTLSILFISLIFIAPIQVSAAANAGVKPGSLFYFFDTAFENVGLFFTFGSENKTRKALEYADERLAEAEESANENDPKAVEKAMSGYKEEISLATEKSKGLKDEERAKELLNIVSENTVKHQEILAGVLEKVPEEAKQAILNAIEVSKKGQEEATRQIAELKKEVSELKQELENLKGELKDKEEEPKASGDKRDEQAKTIDKLKSKIESLKKKVSEPSQKETKTESKKEESKNSIVNLPSGAVVEMDANGNVIRTITATPQQTYTAPAPTTQTQTTTTVQISSVNITPTITSAKIEWQTDKPTESKIFLSGGGLSSKVYNSESGLSTRHSVSIDGLSSNTEYSYEIEAIFGSIVGKTSGKFRTKERVVSSLDIEFSHNNGGYYFGSNCESVSFSAYTEDQAGGFLPGVSVTFTNPETGEKTTQVTQESNESRGKAAVTRFSYTPQARFSPNKTQTVHFSTGSVSAEKTFTIRETKWEDIPSEIKTIMLSKKGSWLDSLYEGNITHSGTNEYGQSQSYSMRKSDWGPLWTFVDMATTTYPGLSHVEKLQNKVYSKNHAWFSEVAGWYFDPDTGMCI